MTAWEVKDYLSHLTCWKENEEDEILSLCKISLNEINSMLKADADRADARIASAAAANAYYKLSFKRSSSSVSEGITSFKAGDVSITQGNQSKSEKILDKAEKLYHEALQSIIPLCQDNGFAFENVKIKVIP